MEIASLFQKDKTVISFEVFPPKKDDGVKPVLDALDSLQTLKPDFISVTCGAGGTGNGKNATAETASYIHNVCKTQALAHLTCAELTEREAEETAMLLKQKGILNVLALKGDGKSKGSFGYAKDLLGFLKRRGFCLGAAAYPEGHISSDDIERDISHLVQKQEAGAEFFITQLFFSNDVFYRFLDKAHARGITCPVSAGIMPILSKSQIQRMIFMCGVSLPSPIIKLINRYGDEGESLTMAGIEYSLNQMQELCDRGVDGIHIYTMNKPFIAGHCMQNLRVKRTAR